MSNQEVIPSNQQVAISNEAQRFLPVMSLDVAIERREAIISAYRKLMKAGEDFGVIPGTNRPTLLQPGADKLNNLFGLVPTFITVQMDLDWTGERHGGEAFCYYEVKCRLMRGEYCMGEGGGSASTWESKYRYRKAERECPKCGAAAIIKGKEEYGGGWLCFLKKNGCGSKFRDGDPSIEGQAVGNKPNPDVADLVNTVLKMANKRAKIAATLNAVSAHEFFSQDLEDNPPPVSPPETQAPAKPETEAKGRAGAAMRPAPPAEEEENVSPELAQVLRIMSSGSREDRLGQFRQVEGVLFELMGEAGGDLYREVLARHGVEHPSGFKFIGPARVAMKELWQLCVAAQQKSPQ